MKIQVKIQVLLIVLYHREKLFAKCFLAGIAAMQEAPEGARPDVCSRSLSPGNR
jgi:hypothetical protein